MSKSKQFERSEEFEAMLRERAENPTRYEASHSFNQKRAAENYEREKQKAEART
ncbi:MAG TPA: hypothetical protein VIQ24_24345 [Pyrinomonadaceae bacterium]